MEIGGELADIPGSYNLYLHNLTCIVYWNPMANSQPKVDAEEEP